jgi:competence protein ComEA
MFRLLTVVPIAMVLALQPEMQAQTQAPPASPKASAGRTQNKPATVVNVNTATAAELAQLPGIGAKTAARIIDYRQKKGPFKKPEELMNVQGIGEKSFLRLKSQIVVTGTPDQKSQQD